MIGFHCSHELYTPRELLGYCHDAHQAGFTAISCSDHISPWSAGGQSGYAWAWLGAAMQQTPLTFGTVCAPGQRYHPVIVAQKAATLAQMFPSRFWFALGTGQNLNEHITGDKWLPKAERQERLVQSVDLMRRLWRGEEVSADGYVQASQAKLYTLPETAPLIFGAAITAETAEWVGSWADGLLTVAKPPVELAKTVAAFRRGGGEGKPMRLQSAVSYAKTQAVAKEAAFRNWGNACLDVGELQDIAMPEEIDRRVADKGASKIDEVLRVSSELAQHIEWIRQDLELGFEAIYLHYVGDDIGQFIQLFGKEVLPHFA